MEKYEAEDFNIDLLGVFYEIKKTAFYCFCTTSEKLFLVIDSHKYQMDKNGHNYSYTIYEDLHLHKYHYELEDGTSFLDPFAYYSDEYDSYILDPNKFYKPKNKTNEFIDPIIYELNVRDFSSHPSYSGLYKGKFLALSQKGLKYNNQPIGIDYLTSLNISHIQLLPINHFDLDHSDYNWGYNPLAFNYLFNGYIDDVGNPYAYINEFAYTVDVLHENGLNVNLDIVFNHVYKYNEFTLYKMLGDRVFRYTKDGKLAEGTLCGNELKSEDSFVKAYLLKMLERYILAFNVDGFRFDLMGILDYQTINYFKHELIKLKKNLLFYGEGWNMGDVLPIDRRASIANAEKLEGVYFFNDYFRDNLIAYLKNTSFDIEAVYQCLKADNILASKQTLNYLECHDNMTLFDQMLGVYHNYDLAKNKCKLALALVLLSKGIPFIHAGQEFIDTKQMRENSYNAGDKINSIDWSRMVENLDLVNYFKKLIELRRKYLIKYFDSVIFVHDFYGDIVFNVGKLRIIINPTEYDYNYHSEDKKQLVFDGKYTCMNPAYDFVVPSFGIILLIDLL